MKKVIFIFVMAILLLTTACLPEVETPDISFDIEDCYIVIKDRLTGVTYYTNSPYNYTISGSNIVIESGYKWVSSIGSSYYEPFTKDIILSGNWILTER